MRGRGRAALPPRVGDRALAGGEVARAARRDESRPASPDAREAHRSARASRPDLRLVHRGLRHARPDRGEGAARGAGVETNEPTAGRRPPWNLFVSVPETPPDRPSKILECARLLRSPVGVPQTDGSGTPHTCLGPLAGYPSTEVGDEALHKAGARP